MLSTLITYRHTILLIIVVLTSHTLRTEFIYLSLLYQFQYLLFSRSYLGFVSSAPHLVFTFFVVIVSHFISIFSIILQTLSEL